VFRRCALERDHLAAQIYFWGGDEHGYTDLRLWNLPPRSRLDPKTSCSFSAR
jgi:hypothetical protein